MFVFLSVNIYRVDFRGGSAVKNIPSVQSQDSVSGLGRSPGERNGKPLHYSCQGNPMDGGAWWTIVHWGHKRFGHNWAHAHIQLSKIHINSADISAVESGRGSLEAEGRDCNLFIFICLFLAVPQSIWDLTKLPYQRSNLCLLQWKLGVLTTGPPRKSLQPFKIVKKGLTEKAKCKQRPEVGEETGHVDF